MGQLSIIYLGSQLVTWPSVCQYKEYGSTNKFFYYFCVIFHPFLHTCTESVETLVTMPALYSRFFPSNLLFS